MAKRELARRHFINFCEYVYPGYKRNWHIDLLADALERTITGEIRFLLVEMPPRHSKSIHVSQMFPAYVMGRDKDVPVIVASYSGDLATDHGRETRNLIDSQEYKNVFPGTSLAPDSQAKGKWHTNGKGSYNALGVGGSATGKGARYFVIDDPFKDREEADSEVVRESRYKWYRSVARTRLTPDGSMIIMHTRWHDDDLIGRLVKDGEDWVDYFDFVQGTKTAKWVRLRLPAIAEHDEVYRKEGESLWPQQFDLSELADIKKTLGSYEWSALYQQNPIDSENQEFRKQWFLPIDWHEVRKKHTRNFLTIDTAISKKASADFTAVVRNYVDRANKWHIASQRYKISPTELIDLLFKLYDEEKYEKIGIEKTIYLDAIKPFLDDEMRKRNKFLPIVELTHNETQKETRIRSLIPRYESKSVFHIEKENLDLEEELLRFPKGTHDDLADALAYQSQIAQPPEYISPADALSRYNERNRNLRNNAR